MTYTLFLFLAIQGFFIFFIVRNNQVHTFLVSLIKQVSEYSTDDLARGLEWEWRWKIFNQASYDYMLYTFWRKLKVENYWHDKSFIEKQP